MNGKLANKLRRGGGGGITEDILRGGGGVDPKLLIDMDTSVEMAKFMEVLHKPSRSTTRQPVEEL